jgi:short-subunit dehydrogenase
MRDLRGTHAVVTGASRGIGPFIATALAERGVNLTLTARSLNALDGTRRQVQALGVRSVEVACDVTSRADLARLADTAQGALGPVDILVNNAGIEVMAPLTEHSFEQIDDVLRTNVTAPIWLTRQLLPAMLARRRGAIVNVASMAGKAAPPYFPVYATSKAALIGFSRSLRAELEGSGVTVGVVCPTFVSQAGMWAKFGGKAPWIAREVSPRQVALAVLRAVEGAEEILVTQGPVRPLLALNELFPGFGAAFMRRLGVTRAIAAESARRGMGSAHRG